METLGIVVFGLGLAFVGAGMVSFALNRGAPESDEHARGEAGETELDLFTMDNEPVEAAIQHSGAVEDTGQTPATHAAENELAVPSDRFRARSIPG